MKISCPSCEAKYSIGDDKVQSRLAKIRCRKCGVDIVIDGRVQPPTVSVGDVATNTHEAMQAAAAASQSYTIDFGENDQRSMTLDEIVAAYNASFVTPETYVWADGMTDWTPLGQVPEIVDALNVVANQAAHVPSAAAAAPRSAVNASRTPTATSTAVTAASAKTAARTTSGGRAGADLFGAISHAGGEEDMARQAASAELAAPQTSTGARNESSVLFSLSALTSSAKSAPIQTMGHSTASAREDSGLIDLKALTAQATETSASPNTVGTVGLGAAGPLGGLGAPLGGLGAPLGGMAPAPVMSPALADISYPQKKNRMGLFIGGGIAVAGICIALVFALKPEPPPPPPKAEPAPVIVYKTPEPEPIKEAAKPPPTGEASAAAPATKKPPVGSGGWKPRPKPGGSSDKGSDSSSGSHAPSAPAAPKPQSGKCGCPPGDLACNMRCAAKGG